MTRSLDQLFACDHRRPSLLNKPAPLTYRVPPGPLVLADLGTAQRRGLST
jgi:hypothetical protein